MRPKRIKDRCTKIKISKCDEVIKTYDKIQLAYAYELDADDEIVAINCNAELELLEEGEFTTDFVCKKVDGTIMVRECVWRKKLMLPRTMKLLDASRNYWLSKGITDFGIIIEKEDKGHDK